MPETAVAESESSVALRALAARYGLTSAAARPTLPAYIRQLWKYRHFMAAYADARVTSSLGDTRLGRLWQVLTPLINAAVYYVIFGQLLWPKHPPNYGSYLCVGVFVFGFTQSAVQAGTQSITSNLGLIRALQFPRASLPISATLIELQHIMVGMAVLSVIVLVTGEPLTWEWLLIVPILLLQAVFSAGLAMFTARLGSKMIDLKQVMPFALRVWMYGSAIIYPVQMFRDHGFLTTLLNANPAVVYIELMRHAMMEDVEPAIPLSHLWLYAIGWAALSGMVGFIYFWRGEKEYGRG